MAGGADMKQGERSQLIPKIEKDTGGVVTAEDARGRKKRGYAMLIGVVIGAIMMVWLKDSGILQLASLASTDNDSEKVQVKCQDVPMPELTSKLKRYRSSRICYPDDGNKYPLHFFGHGNFGGGPFSFAYNGILNDIASHGFVVVMYLSCALDMTCDRGNASFLELLKSAVFLESNTGWWDDKIDFDVGYSASGHSTGGRVTLMLGALIDNPTKYLVDTKYDSLITAEMRKVIPKFQALIGDHPDPMYSPGPMSPDVDNFVVDKTPFMIVTGSKDIIEPELSAWKDFQIITSPDKVYVDMLGTGHLGPLISHKEGPYIAYFSQCFIGGVSDEVASKGCENIYGDAGPPEMRSTLSIATVGDRNTGDGKVGFLGCRGGSLGDVPADLAEFCASG